MRAFRKKGFTRYLLLLLFSLTIAITGACGGGSSGGGGGNNNQTPPPATGTISGSVSGTIIVAVNDSGDIVATDDTTGKTPDANGNYPFTLTEIPTGVNIRVYLITDTGVYPMYFDSDNNTTPDTNVFSLTSAATISLGFVAITNQQAIPANDPTDTAEVNAGVENANLPIYLTSGTFYTTSGTYDYNSGTGALTVNITISNSACIKTGTENSTVTTLTSTTMISDGGTVER